MKVIFFELNEVPYKVIHHFCKLYPESNLAKVFLKGRKYETYAEDQGHLSPWITWPTVHRGINNEKHFISDFGQNLTEQENEYPAIWNILAKNGVVLIEPNEIYVPSRALTGRLWIGFKQFIKKIIGQKNLHIDTGNYEPVGNYVYTVSKREIEKVALGIGLTTVAFYYFNDVYVYGTEFEKAESGSMLFKKIKADIRKKDIRSKLGLDPYKNIIVIIFKQPPSEKLCKELIDNKFEIVQLPENPYIAR